MESDVCEELKALRAEVKQLIETVTLLRIDVAGLKIKSGAWGLVGGIISIVSVLLAEKLIGH